MSTAEPPTGRRRLVRRRVRPPGRGALSPTRVAAFVVIAGLLVTALVTWAAWTLNDRNEHRLLEVQTKQAGAVIGSTILGIQDPLTTALQTESATGGDPVQFKRFMSAYVGPGKLFAAASLWAVQGSSARPVVSVGVAPALAPTSSATQAFIAQALHRATVVVTSISAGGHRRIGYAVADPQSPALVVYAERAIPADRQVPVERNSAFSDLDYATYLGPSTGSSNLETTDVPMSQLPLSGDVVRDEIPFGDTTLTLVAAPRGRLGGTLGAELPWVFLVGGVLLTGLLAVAAVQLVSRRRQAEEGAQTVAHLYGQLDALYGEQRTIAETLWRALLPQSNPSVPDLEIASRYVAGVDGIDVGGDWYSLIALDADRFAFVVGDVSGRGVSAASVMARLRFTIRAYLWEGHPPDVALEMCARQININEDGHFATVLVGIGDRRAHEIVLANAGHLNPLVVTSEGSAYAGTTVGLPLGVADSAYVTTTLSLAAGSTFLAFTDGLVERRGESIDDGLERLASAATTPASTLEDLLTSIVAQLAEDGSEDDIAVLAFRWREPT